MKNIKLFLTLAAVCMFGIDAASQASLTINGVVAEQVVAEMSFDGNDALITYSDATKATLPLYQLSLSPSGSCNALENVYGIDFYVAQDAVGKNFTIGGMGVGQSVKVYDIVGRMVIATTATTDPFTVDASHLAKGVHIVLVGNRTAVKIIVK